MTYVTEQTSTELREHMKRLTSLPGWNDPLSARLWKEIQDLNKRAAELDQAVCEEIENRDRWEEKATGLAQAAGQLIGVDVGEHSSANCPIETAMRAITEADFERDQLAAQNERLRARLIYASETFEMLEEHTHPSIECDAIAASCLEPLAESPAASLAEHDAKLLFETADDLKKVAKSLSEITHAKYDLSTVYEEVAALIGAAAETKLKKAQESQS